MKITTVIGLVSIFSASSVFLSCDDDGASGGGPDGGTGGADGAVSGLDTLPGTGGSSSMTPDPCTLLTVAEWTPLMNGAPTVGTPAAGWCDWSYRENGTRQQRGSLIISGAGAYSASPGSQAIDIGDMGYVLVIDLARAVDIGWKKGAFSVTFTSTALVLPTGKTWPEQRDAAIALARLAASRMP